MKIAKAVKLKAVWLDFTGRSRTERHRGSLPETYSDFEEKEFIKHSWLFFDTRLSCPPQRVAKDIYKDSNIIPGFGTICGVYTSLRPSSIQSDSHSSNTDFNLDQNTTEQKYLPFSRLVSGNALLQRDRIINCSSQAFTNSSSSFQYLEHVQKPLGLGVDAFTTSLKRLSS